MSEQYNPKCAGVKRLMKEASELREPTEMYFAQPLEDNLFEWHFTVRGTLGTEFDGGIYHGRLIFPAEYPMKPPNIIILTPNGRFETNKKICLSISGYHPETWLPSWSIRTALLALIGFMPTNGAGAVGSLQYPEKERKKLAAQSVNWKCEHCQIVMKDVLLPLSEDESNTNANKDSEEAKSLASQLKFADESDVKKEVAALEKKEKEESVAENSEPSSQTEIENVEVPSSDVTESATSSTPLEPSVDHAPQRIRTQSFRQFSTTVSGTNQQNDTSSSCDFALFVFIPLLLAIAALSILLLSRRVLL